MVVVSQIKMLPLGCRSEQAKHVMSFRRQAYIVLPTSNVDKVLNVVLKFRIKDHDYQVYASTETLKCFTCGKFGHLKRFCSQTASSVTEQTGSLDNTVPPSTSQH